MQNRLRDAVSPYLRSHADNPVDWFAWGEDAFAEAERRQVPVLVSIGYSTCHWCHVMARESFSDPALADYLNANFVAIKVDREEHPDVDSSYLAAASAFTENLGWPLNVFVTPAGKAFFAGTYWPPTPGAGRPSFRQVLDAVVDAFTQHRLEVESSAAEVTGALAATAHLLAGPLPTDYFAEVAELVGYEDTEFGGFGSAPKFPSVPVLQFLLERGSVGDADALALASRTLTAMAGSALRDPVEGGFFRYSTRRNWTEPHYERMLYDNALLLSSYTRLEQLAPGGHLPVIEGLVGFLTTTMRLPGGGFASAQDSESTVDGVRVEGGYYALDAGARAAQVPPALDEKVLAGWNGLAIDALALAGFVFDRSEWTDAARTAAEYLIARQLEPDGTLLRTSIADRVSTARATLEDYGMLAGGLLRLATATGEVRFAVTARHLVDASLSAGAAVAEQAHTVAAPKVGTPLPFAVPGGSDPVLAARGLALDVDPSEGAYPSGLSAMAGAAHQLYLLTGERHYRDASLAAVAVLAPLAVQRSISFGGALAVMSALGEPAAQLLVVTDGAEAAGPDVAAVARHWYRSGGVSTVVSRAQAQGFADAGFELFAGRQRAAAYFCHDFVCRLPVTAAAELESLLVE